MGFFSLFLDQLWRTMTNYLNPKVFLTIAIAWKYNVTLDPCWERCMFTTHVCSYTRICKWGCKVTRLISVLWSPLDFPELNVIERKSLNLIHSFMGLINKPPSPHVSLTWPILPHRDRWPEGHRKSQARRGAHRTWNLETKYEFTGRNWVPLFSIID